MKDNKIDALLNDFIFSYNGNQRHFQTLYRALRKNFYIADESDINDELFFDMFNYLKVNLLKRNGELNMRGMNGLVRFYVFFMENGIGNFQVLTRAMLNSKDFLSALLRGFTPVKYSPYAGIPEEDKLIIDIGAIEGGNDDKKIIYFDSSYIENDSLKKVYKDFFWCYREKFSNKTTKDCWLKLFFSVMNDTADEIPIEITSQYINDFKKLIEKNKSTSVAVALSRVRQFVDFESQRGNIKITEFNRRLITSFDCKSRGDTRAYNEKELEKIKEEIKKSGLFKDELIVDVINILQRTPMRPATVVNLERKCLKKVGKDGYLVACSSKKVKDDVTPVDIKTGLIIENDIEKTRMLLDKTDSTTRNKVFIYEALKGQNKIKKLQQLDVSKRINAAAEALGFNQLGTKGIRNLFNRRLNQLDIESGANGEIIKGLSKHSIAVHTNYYSEISDFFSMCQDYYDVEIGDIEIPGRVTREAVFSEEHVVQHGCGFCSADKCLNSRPDECQNCKHFVATLANLEYFKREVARLDEVIRREESSHEKEFATYRKAQCVRYITELLLLKNNLIEA